MRSPVRYIKALNWFIRWRRIIWPCSFLWRNWSYLIRWLRKVSLFQCGGLIFCHLWTIHLIFFSILILHFCLWKYVMDSIIFVWKFLLFELSFPLFTSFHSLYFLTFLIFTKTFAKISYTILKPPFFRILSILDYRVNFFRIDCNVGLNLYATSLNWANLHPVNF